jgi:hypothetical protein
MSESIGSKVVRKRKLCSDGGCEHSTASLLAVQKQLVASFDQPSDPLALMLIAVAAVVVVAEAVEPWDQQGWEWKHERWYEPEPEVERLQVSSALLAVSRQ